MKKKQMYYLAQEKLIENKTGVPYDSGFSALLGVSKPEVPFPDMV